uniref:Uncharacterized protein n=1 Tax=Physcomitrium patens TaxID=3218 RepID=A0A2K1LBX4_PHYPA|nr:hypothetical protein PHYPA_001954 [Physcomitrium patens]
MMYDSIICLLVAMRGGELIRLELRKENSLNSLHFCVPFVGRDLGVTLDQPMALIRLLLLLLLRRRRRRLLRLLIRPQLVLGVYISNEAARRQLQVIDWMHSLPPALSALQTWGILELKEANTSPLLRRFEVRF